MKAVLFDYDGVLADSMETNYQGWKAAFKQEGADIQRDDYFPLEGSPLREVVRIIAEKYGLEGVDAKEIISRKEKYFKENYTLTYYPGVPEITDSLKQNNILISVVTAALQERLYSTNPKSFLDKFDSVTTGDNTERGKPNPDPYLRSMEELGVKAEDCIVVENAPLGIESAKRAGAYCIAIASTTDKKYLEKADEIIDKFADLRNVEKIKELLS